MRTPTLQVSGVYSDLKHRGIIKLSGRDQNKFLQNLLSNDIEKLKPDELQYSLLLSPQGKVLYDFFVFKLQGDICLDCNKAYAEEIIKRLYMHKLHSNIDIALQPEISVYISNDRLTQSFYPDPRNINLGFRGYTANTSELTTFTMNSDLLGLYEEKRLVFLVPEFGVDFMPGEFWALELGMDKLNAISFQKGCYIGQEVTARMNYRGTNKKQLSNISLQNFVIKDRELFQDSKKVGLILKKYNKTALALIKNNSTPKSN